MKPFSCVLYAIMFLCDSFLPSFPSRAAPRRASQNQVDAGRDWWIVWYDGSWYMVGPKCKAARAALDFLTASYGFKLILEEKTLHLLQVSKNFTSMGFDQDMIITQPGSAQPQLSCAYVCAVVQLCLMSA